MKRIFILSSSLRAGSNSDVLAEQFKKGAQESGNSVIKVNVRDVNFTFCKGCLYCQKHEKCVINDDMNALCETVRNCDVLVFATPIYYYEMSGQMKTFLDRLNPLYVKENNFKEVYLLATAADTDERAMDGAIKGMEGWIECFDGVTLKAVVRGLGAENAGDVKQSSAYVQAYEMGKAVD